MYFLDMQSKKVYFNLKKYYYIYNYIYNDRPKTRT